MKITIISFTCIDIWIELLSYSISDQFHMKDEVDKTFELQHETKPTVWPVHPVWSEFSLCFQWVAKGPRYLHVDSEDSDQTGRMPRLIWVFTGRTDHIVGFVM